MGNPLRIVLIGHVDHGKSTLIGRLLYDTGSLPDGKKAELEKITQRRRLQGVEWSFVLDAFQAERDQNVTIDTTQVRFKTAQRDYVLIDAPGHREFLKNMISGAAAAEAAVLVIDVNEGVQEQTRRHAYLAHLLGLKQAIVVLNKMDVAGYSEKKFNDVKSDIEKYLASFEIVPAHVIPLSARNGEMIVERHANMLWYKGPVLVEALDSLSASPPLIKLPLRFPVQGVYKFENERIVVGRIESGTLKKGDMLQFSPGTQQARVTTIKVWPDNHDKITATVGESIGITLDQRIFVERGHMASQVGDLPSLAQTFKARIFWLSDKSLKAADTYKIRYAMQESQATVQAIDRIVNVQDLSQEDKATTVLFGQIVELTLRTHDMLALDAHEDHSGMGQIVLYRGADVVGGGIVLKQGLVDLRDTLKASNLQAVDHLISYDRRAAQAGYSGQVFWLTGLSAAGKSTLAMLVEKNLFERGYHTYVLDGDNIRRGLCEDLGFSDKDRHENIRRVGEVAALMADAGLVVITAFISPFQVDRNHARKAAQGRFHEIYIEADLNTCETRDPKGLYRKARAGEIRDFTGINSPYEVPERADLVVDTSRNDIDMCVAQILNYIETHISLKAKQGKIRAF